MVGLSLATFWVHTITVETHEGHDSNGPIYSAPVTVPCFVDDSTKLVAAPTGDQVVSQSTVFADSSYAPLFVAESRLTVNGRATRVITVNNYTSGPLGLPDHVEVAVQ